MKLTYLQLFRCEQLVKKLLVRLMLLLLMVGMLPGALLAQRLDLTKPLAIKWFNKLSEESRFAAVYGTDAVNLSLASGKLIAVQASSGQLIWKADLGGEINNELSADGQALFVITEALPASGHDSSLSPQVSLLALSQKSGLTLWRRYLPNTVRGGISSDKTKLFFGTSTGVVYAVNKTTGETIWLKPISSAPFLSILVKNDDIFIYSENGNLTSLKTEDGSTNWRYQTPSASHGATAIVGDYLSIGGANGQIYCLDKNTGQLRWRSRMNGGLQTLTAADNGFIASASDNYVYFFSLSLGKRIWKRRFAGRIVASPLVEAGNALFISLGSNEAIILACKDGKFLNTVQVGDSNAIITTPVVANDILLVPTREGLVGFASRS